MKNTGLLRLNICIGAMLAVPALGAVTVTLTGPTDLQPGEQGTYKIYVTANPSVDVRAWQVTKPCSASGGTSGSFDYVVPGVINTSAPDYIFAGVPSLDAVDEGTCPGGYPRAADTTNPPVAVTVGSTPKYIAEFTYEASPGSGGTFTIDFFDPSGGTVLVDQDMIYIPAT